MNFAVVVKASPGIVKLGSQGLRNQQTLLRQNNAAHDQVRTVAAVGHGSQNLERGWVGNIKSPVLVPGSLSVHRSQIFKNWFSCEI